MTLALMEPTPTWDAEAHERTVAAFSALADDDGVTITVWCRDNCPDCRRELPDFAAAVEAAGFPDERLRQVVVDDDNDGPLVGDYGVEFIPTVVVERGAGDGPGSGPDDREELARFVEEERLPAAQHLAEALRAAGEI